MRIDKLARSAGRNLSLLILGSILALGGFLMSCEDTITAQVKEEVKTAALPDRVLTILAPTTGTVTPGAGSHNLKEGKAFNIAYSLAGGYTFMGWTKAGGAGTATFADPSSVSTTVTLSGGDVSIMASATNQPRTLSLQNDGNGTTSPASTAIVADGVDSSINASPSPGYVFSNWTYSSGAGTPTFGNANNAATTVKLTGGDATIQANFVVGTYSLTLSAGATPHGSLNQTSPYTIHGGGETVLLQATPVTDYSFTSWSVSPSTGAVSLANGSTTNPVSVTATNNATITANWAIKTYALTINSSNVYKGYATSSKTVQGGVASAIVASPYATRKFINWTKTGGAGIVTFADASAASTNVTVSQGAATIQANFADMTASLASAGSVFSPGSNTFPAIFEMALARSNRLMVVGKASSSDSYPSVVGWLNIQTPTNILALGSSWSGGSNSSSYNFQSITTDYTLAYLSTDTNVFSFSLSDGQFANLGQGTGMRGGKAIQWDGSKLWTIGMDGILKDVSTSTLKPTGLTILTDAGLNQGDYPSSLYDLASSNMGLIATGQADDASNNYTNILSVFLSPIATGTRNYPSGRNEDGDLTNGWFDMGYEPLGPISVHPDGDYGVAIAPYPDGSFWLKTLDLADPAMSVLYQTQITAGGSDIATYCYYGQDYILVAGLEGGKATIWIYNGVYPGMVGDVAVQKYQNASYAGGAFFIGQNNSNPNVYFVVCKTSSNNGTDKLVVVPLSLSEN